MQFECIIDMIPFAPRDRPECPPAHPIDLVVREVEPPHEPHAAEGVGVQAGQVVAVQMQHTQ